MHKQLLLVLLLVALPALAHAQISGPAASSPANPASEPEAIRAAVLDYVEGIYTVQPERIERSVHPDLAKVGYWMPSNATTYQGARMTFDQLVELAKKWNANGRVDAETARKEIEILDMMDQTATVKLSAQWGVDYMHLAKIDDHWMIMNVLWQSYPPAPSP